MGLDERIIKLCKSLSKSHGELIVSVVLVGSLEPGRDIDLIVIYDDLFARERGRSEESVEEEIRDFLDMEGRKLGFGGVKRRGERAPPGVPIDLFSLSLSRVWPLLEERNPYILSYLEDGVTIVDRGFFHYLQKLNRLGIFKPNLRSAWEFFERASERAYKPEMVKLLILAEDCYNAIMGSAIALLMREGIRVPPQMVYEEFKKRFVKRGEFDPEKASWIKEILELRKKIERGELREIEGKIVDEWISKAKEFTTLAEKVLKSH